MKLTIKIFLVVIIAASTIFADGDLGNGGFTCDGDLGNGGFTCTVDCPEPSDLPETDCGTDAQNSSEADDDSILTVIEDYLESLFR
jgi:hypothetical protein